MRTIWISAAMALLAGGLMISAVRGTGLSQPMPTLPPSPTPICAGQPPTRLILYERGRVTNDTPTPSNLRSGPGTAYQLVGNIPANGVFFVLDGPKCSQRYVWYRVRYGKLEGWLAEGTFNTYYTEPYLPG